MFEEIKRRIYYTVANSNQMLTPIEVAKKVSSDMKVDRKIVEKAIKELVKEELLKYTYFGNSFLQISMDRPVRISRRIIIKPPHKKYSPQKQEIVIDIKPGAAFGDGGHPSTYLLLRMLDNLMSTSSHLNTSPLKNALDVGTGSGILAIAAAKFGIKEVIGIDINPSALFEAKENIRINNLLSQIIISGSLLEDIDMHFSLIMANIGSKTLSDLCPLLVQRLERNGFLILSGFTINEYDSILKKYLQFGLILIESLKENNWICLTLSKPFYKNC